MPDFLLINELWMYYYHINHVNCIEITTADVVCVQKIYCHINSVQEQGGIREWHLCRVATNLANLEYSVISVNMEKFPEFSENSVQTRGKIITNKIVLV